MPPLIHDLTDHLAAPKNETVLPAFMNAEPAITTNMTDPPLNRRSKRRRNSKESTSSKKPDDVALAPPTETRNKKLKRINKLASSSSSESLSFSDTETTIDKSNVKSSPPSKPVKRALDFTVLPESSSPMSEPSSSKRHTDFQDEDDRALKRTKFMSETPPSTPTSNIKLSPPPKPVKRALDFTVLPESSSPISDPATRVIDPQDKDDRALKSTEFISNPLPSTPLASNLKRSIEAEDDYIPKCAKFMSESPQLETRDVEEHSPNHSNFTSESPSLVPKSSTSQNLTQEQRTRIEKNRKAAEEIRNRTKSTLTPVIELLALDSKLKGINPRVELRSKEVSAITPEQRQRMKANHEKALSKKKLRESNVPKYQYDYKKNGNPYNVSYL